MRKTLGLGLVAALGLAGCRGDEKKIEHGGKEIGLLADSLMRKNTVPSDQPHFEKLTREAGSAIDPWGTPYQYERQGIRVVRIYSRGPDGKEGTDDDFGNEFTFPSGTGLEEYTIQRADGDGEALKSPDETRTFWTTQRIAGDNQIVDYWVGDAAAKAKKPIRSATVNTNEYRRGVTLVRWSGDSRYVTVREVDSASRPDYETRRTDVTFDVTTGKEVEEAQIPEDVAWLDY